MKIKSQAKRLREGPVFRITEDKTFNSGLYLEGQGKGVGEFWTQIGIFKKREYALMLMKAITLKAKEKK